MAEPEGEFAAANRAVLDRLAARFAPDDLETFIGRLSQSPTYDGDLSWLTSVLDAADLLPMPEVPADVSGRLHGLINPRAATIVEEPAVLHDSRRDAELAGVRGPDDPGKWTLALSAQHGDVLIDARTGDDGRTRISGHVLSRTAADGPYVITAAGSETVVARSDDLGQFDLGQLAVGNYAMTARRTELEFRWEMEVT